MVGPSEQSPSGKILDFFGSARHEPVTASEIASETGYSFETVRTELDELVDRGFLRTKEVGETERVWWPPLDERGDGERTELVLSLDDTSERGGTRAARQRLIERHRQLAQFVARIDVTDDLDEILRLVTEEARELVGAHQSVTSRTVNQNWEQAIYEVSLSEKYAEYREYDTRPDGSGIYSLVCERNEPMRMTQAELEAHPAWSAFGEEGDEHPPMDGWLAVPIVGPDDRNKGLIQLSDKYRGEFTETDEAILVQLANVASAAIENARLYDELRESEERYRTLFESMTEGYCVVERVDAAPEEPVDFRYVEANPAFETHTGLHEVVGETIRDTVPDGGEEYLDIFDSVVQSGEAVTFERELGTRERILQCQAFPIGDAPNEQVGMTTQDITERVEHGRRLEERERQLSTLMENVPGMVYRCRNERGWPMEFVSDACREVTGYDPGALVDGDVNFGEDVVLDEDREDLWDEIQTSVTDREPFSVTYRIETADGERRWVRDSGRGIFDDEDTLAEIEGIISDVTERKRAEQQLAQERDMFADGPAVVFRWEPDEEAGWPVEYVSENVEDVLGYAPEEFESGKLPYADLLHEDEIDRIAREVEENRDRTTERFSHEPYRVTTKDGGTRWVKDTTKIIRDDDGTITNYLGYLVDITERKERERELRESRRRYRTLVENFPNGAVTLYDEDLRYITAGGENVGQVGITVEEMKGSPVTEVLPDELAEQLVPRYRAAVEEGESRAFEVEYGDRHYQFYALPVRDEDGDVFAGVGMSQDITERKEYERRLEASNERLEQFAYAASHDLQEPLRMISSYLQLVEDRYADTLDEDGREFIEFAVDGADRMREMIEGLLEYSRVGTQGDPFEPVDLDAVFEDVCQDLRVKIEEHDAEIAAEDLPRVHGDGSQLSQVFQNLLDNAIEYSGDEPPRVRVSAERTDGGDRWIVSVRDEGIGIDPGNADRVFEVFGSLQGHDNAGTGIGLALCERIVERHGGDIWIDSEPGEGATFSFTLPAVGESDA